MLKLTVFVALSPIGGSLILNMVYGAPPRDVPATLEAFAEARNKGLPELRFDFTEATILASPAPGPETKAVQVLVEEVERRTLVRWPITDEDSETSGPVVIAGTFPQVSSLLAKQNLSVRLDSSAVSAEGYQIVTLPGQVAGAVIAGKDARGVLFGVGHFLRKLHMGPNRAGLMEAINLSTSPAYPLRGNQLGYRAKPHAYTGWNLAQMEQYIRELALFGANAVELIPPRSDDLDDSMNFTLPPLDMMRAMSQICDDYGLDVWVWYPAIEDDYTDPQTVAYALEEWGEVFRALPRVDAVLVPGGDPGHTPPRILFPFLEKQLANIRTHHPDATLWVSPQGFGDADMEYFFEYLGKKSADWLSGVVYAPWVPMDLGELRKRVPQRFPIRFYPDITHTLECQYPVPDWDFAHARTANREPICPRPLDMAHIIRQTMHHTIGAVIYSEGTGDDVNKFIWNGLGWNPDTDPREILLDYSRLFISERLAEDFTDGLFGLEENWRGPLATNQSVPAMLELFKNMEERALPQDLRNWRFLMGLYRAYFDYAVQQRVLHGLELEAQALEVLSSGGDRDPIAAMDEAERIWSGIESEPVAPLEHRRVYELGEALFQTIHMQLSMKRHGAVGISRGATLDTFTARLDNGPWMLQQFEGIRGLDGREAQARALRAIIDWEDAGPGGFYDDLGKPSAVHRFVNGRGWEEDPGYLNSVVNAHSRSNIERNGFRTSWLDSIASFRKNPLSLHYSDLNPESFYELTVIYAPQPPGTTVQVTADNGIVLLRFSEVGRPGDPAVYEIPRSATSDGELTVTWIRNWGKRLGANNGLLAESWLRVKAK